MTDTLQQWHEEHVRFARLLDLLELEVAAFHAGKQPDYDVMHDIVHYLQEFADVSHHPREDVALERLVKRDKTMNPIVNRLLQEHRVIATAGDELLRRIDGIEAGALTERAALESAAATFLSYYRHHLSTEETQILPRAKEVLTREDWAAVAAAAPDLPDPLFGDDFDARYGDLRRLVLAETRQA